MRIYSCITQDHLDLNEDRLIFFCVKMFIKNKQPGGGVVVADCSYLMSVIEWPIFQRCFLWKLSNR